MQKASHRQNDFLMVSHFVNWWSDHIGYSKWFEKNSIAKRPVYGGSNESFEPIVDALAMRLKELQHVARDFEDVKTKLAALTAADFARMSDVIPDAREIVRVSKQLGLFEQRARDLGHRLKSIE